MNILIAADKFKDALSAADVCAAIARGVRRTFPEAVIQEVPLADGGEGTLDVLHQVRGGEWITRDVQDPLGRPVEAGFLWWPETRSAVVEMARASGLELLREAERNCLLTSSFGTGELIAHALDLGAQSLTLTVGGTATNDAGIGMAAALGYRFFDEKGALLAPIGRHLGEVAQIDRAHVHRRLVDMQVVVATDVTSPFYGPLGAAQVFTPQKGADAAGVQLLDAGMEKLAVVFEHTFGKSVQQMPGSGAGGGMGGGAVCFLNAEIRSGADWVLDLCDLQAKLAWAEVLITGEGKIDDQSTQGKLLSRLLDQAEASHTPAILVCGTLAAPDALLDCPAVTFAASILNRPMPLREALEETSSLLQQQGAWLGKWLKRGLNRQ